MASEEVQKKAEAFFHHEKPEHPPTDTEVGKVPAGEPRGSEAEPEQVENPLKQPVERRVKESLKQADQYGEEPEIPLTKPQTLLDEQNPFAASRDNEALKEPREPINVSTTNIQGN